jgi:hypothetical protein
MSGKEKFQLLTQRLKTCPSRSTIITPKRLFETWSAVRKQDPEHGDAITPAILAAVILFDQEMFESLLTEPELTQLVSIAEQALARYQLKTNPPNQPGKLLFAALKEST